MVAICRNLRIFSMRIDKLLETDDKANLVLYSMYITLYINDFACNSYKDVYSFSRTFDKESKKLYRALMRRINYYFEQINKVLGDKSEYVANIFSLFDDMVEPYAEEYHWSLCKLYGDVCDYDGNEFYALVEFSRSLVDICVAANVRITENLSKAFNEEVDNLISFRLTEIQRVSNNFADWVYRHCDTSKIDINKRNYAVSKMNELVEALVSKEMFDNIYNQGNDND